MMITLHLTRGTGHKAESLRLPASKDEESRVFAKLDEISDDVGSTRITEAICYMSNLAQYIKSADVNGPDYEKLKRLAEQLDHMTEQERRIFSGALDAESINGLDNILHIADDLGSYELIEDVICDRDLGAWLVEHDMLGVKEPLNKTRRTFWRHIFRLDFVGRTSALFPRPCGRGPWKTAAFLPPLPTESASLGFGGGPE